MARRRKNADPKQTTAMAENTTEEKVMETPKKEKMIYVRAVGKDNGQVVGYREDIGRIRAGQVFQIEERLFSDRWMEKVSADAVSEVPEDEGREHVALSDVNPVTGARKV